MAFDVFFRLPFAKVEEKEKTFRDDRISEREPDREERGREGGSILFFPTALILQPIQGQGGASFGTPKTFSRTFR